MRFRFEIDPEPFTPSTGVTTQLISSSLTGNTYKTDMQYLLVPVIQGKMISVSVTILGNAFETIAVSDPLLEDASNVISTRFFAVTALLPNTTESIPITRYDDIFLADNLEYAYDISVSVDLTTTKIRFGDGTTGRLLPKNTLVTITYLQSLGSNGNITSQYIVNNIGSSLSNNLYASNLSPILGGEDSDTVEDIRNKAPQAYLSGGKSIVSAQEYRAAMLTLPYIYNVNVYSGLYLDPLSNSLQSTIYYTAIDLLGYDAVSTTSFMTDLPIVLNNRISPLDILTYISPNFLHIRYNMRGVLSNTSSTDIGTLTTALTSELYTNFGTIAQNFFTPFNSRNMDKYIVNKYTDVSLDVVMVEAIESLVPSSFIVDISYTGYYKKTFSLTRHLLPSMGLTTSTNIV